MAIKDDPMFRKIQSIYVARHYYFADLRFHLSRSIGPYVFLAMYRFALIYNRSAALAYLLASLRSRVTETGLTLLKVNLQAIVANYFSANKLVSKNPKPSRMFDRLLVVAYPTPNRKGLVFIKFTETFHILLLDPTTVRRLLRDYHLVLEPSWSGYALPEILAWTAFAHSKIFIECAEKDDFRLISELKGNLVPLRIGSGDWVDYGATSAEAYRSPTAKKYDITLVANFNPIKRIHVFFRMLNKITAHKPIKAALVCANFGSQRLAVEKLLSLHRHLEINYFVDLNTAQLNEILLESKYVSLLTLKEGSNRSLFEAVALNCPIILLAGNVGVNRDNVNAATGHIFTEKEIVRFFIGNPDPTKHPRHWGIEHISHGASMEKVLQAVYGSDYRTLYGQFFRNKVNSPEMAYDYEDALFNRKANHDCLNRYFSDCD